MSQLFIKQALFGIFIALDHQEWSKIRKNGKNPFYKFWSHLHFSYFQQILGVVVWVLQKHPWVVTKALILPNSCKMKICNFLIRQLITHFTHFTHFTHSTHFTHFRALCPLNSAANMQSTPSWGPWWGCCWYIWETKRASVGCLTFSICQKAGDMANFSLWLTNLFSNMEEFKS